MKTKGVPELKMGNFRMLIGGEMVESESKRWFPSINPANEEVLAEVPLGSAKDVEIAVKEAEKAQPSWASLSMGARSEYLRKLADGLKKRAEELLYLEVLDTGNTIYKMQYDVGIGIAQMLYYSGIGYELKGSTIPSTPGNFHITVREPYGVVGRIVPFNHPILFAIGKMGAPLTAGNTMVIKPSRSTPLSACVLGEVCREVLPPGVVNIVTGYSDEVGNAIVRHPRVKRIALTGSVKAGLEIQHAASEIAVKHITLELGGKNPMIVFPDADLSKAVPAVVENMNFAWQGQSCGSTSRLLLHESIYNEVLQGAVELISALRVGDPLDWDSQMGPINNKSQYEKVKYYCQAGIEDGAKLMTGGKRPEGRRFERGYWIEPTVFGDVKPGMRIAEEEIFGPVLSVMKWKSLDELKEIANFVDVGLTGSIWTRDINTALTTSQWLQAGYIWINGIVAHYPGVPFGGYKNSGIGREEDSNELLSYTEEKTINIIL